MDGDLSVLWWEQESPGDLRPGAVPCLTPLPLGKTPGLVAQSYQLPGAGGLIRAVCAHRLSFGGLKRSTHHALGACCRLLAHCGSLGETRYVGLE